MSSANTDYGQAVQVVRVSDDPRPRYVLNTEALLALLERPEVRGRPVAIVSVAGAFRGGKSFLLGFFLRYLNASREKQLNGQWLGGDNEPLTGFKWRAGCHRETTGIHLWSKPAIVTLKDGQEVAVLLMDTQGTFDSESTLQDSSTIFALSTLISSVQIYNIFRNIKEDDLQHLHLFTEYGQLGGAGGDGGKDFQVLQFLVRDWPSGFDYAYGADGGQQLLDRRLQMSGYQNKELREVREHIHSCFESIRCFLMPHPGFPAEGQNFSGCVKDLKDDFKMGLKEFVPSLFDPQNLSVKVIGGNVLMIQDVFLYLKTYLDIFNSEEMPPAISIVKGTAAAWLASAQRNASDVYDAKMTLPAKCSITTNTLHRRHAAALQAALNSFTGTKKLGNKEDAEKYYRQLTKDLQTRLAAHLWQNDVKLKNSFAASKKFYDDMMGSGQQGLCLHSLDLEELHDKTLAKALETFDSTRSLENGEVDEDRVVLNTQLMDRYRHLVKMNEHNNMTAVEDAKMTYMMSMKTEMPANPGPDTLQYHHERATAAARHKFASRRSRPTEQQEDDYLNKLTQGIEKLYRDIERSNWNSNNVALLSAEQAYNNHMTTQWGPMVCCYHPMALKKLHRAAVKVAKEAFHSTRNKREDDEDDSTDELKEALVSRLRYYQHNNEFNNEQAVDTAYELYLNYMSNQRPGYFSWFFTIFGNPTKDHHKKGVKKAENDFFKKRRGDRYDDDDEYLDNLREKIAEALKTSAWDSTE